MVSFMAMALAIALTYVVGDLYRPVVPMVVAWAIDLVVCVVIFRLARGYLRKLKE